MVHPQGVAQVAQQAGDGTRGCRQLDDIGEVSGEVAGGATDPAQVRAGVASGVVAKQNDELSGQRRLFFSSLWRPPPGLRTRSVS